MKTFEQAWFEHVGGDHEGPNRIWSDDAKAMYESCAEEYKAQIKGLEHKLANKIQAVNFQNKKIEHLERELSKSKAFEQVSHSQREDIENRLKEADEVIAFYADRSKWDRDYEMDSTISDFKTYWRIGGEDLEENDWQNAQHGGKRAREYQKKHLTALKP
jgi:hypothetical protein